MTIGSTFLRAGLAALAAVALGGCGRPLPAPAALGQAVGAPDGSAVALVTVDETDTEGLVWRLDLSPGAAPVLLGRFVGPTVGPLAWSADGRLIALASGPPEATLLQVLSVQQPRRRPVRTIRLAGGGWPQWSPRSHRLTWTPGVETPQPGLPLLDVDTNRRSLLSLRQGTGASFPHWSPDGTRLCYLKSPATMGLWAIDVADGAEKPIMGPEVNLPFAAWAGPEEIVAPSFRRGPGGKAREFHAVSVDRGGRLRRSKVTTLPAREWLPSFRWEPGCERALVLGGAARAPKGDIYLLTVGQAQPRRLTRDGQAITPSWLTKNSIVYVHDWRSLRQVDLPGGAERELIEVRQLAGSVPSHKASPGP